MIERKAAYDELWTNKTAEMYVIYDLDTCEIYDAFLTQRACIERYQADFACYPGIAWCKIDIIDHLRKDRAIEQY